MTSRTGTPTALTAYLRRATWGLPKARQQELWDELEEHVLTRVDHLCALGAPPQEALAQALRELGPPTRVTAGMTRVYLMPKLLLSAGVAALALSAALYALAGGGGDRTVVLPALSSSPPVSICVLEMTPKGRAIKNSLTKPDGLPDIGTCSVSNNPAFYAGAFIGLNDLKKAFEAIGITASYVPLGNLEIHFPSGTRRLLTPSFQREDQGYVEAATLIIATVREPVTPTLQLSGYDNPILNLGRLRLQMGSAVQPVSGVDFYRDLFPTLVGVLTTTNLKEGWSASVDGINRRLTPTPALPQHTMQTGLKAGEVVMLVTGNTRNGTRYFADVVPVNADGTATFYNNQAHLRFVSDPAQLSPNPTGGRVNALLVRVTNVPLRDLRSGIFLPAQRTSDAQ